MADDSTPKSNPKPIPKPGSLKPASSSKKDKRDYKSLTGRQKAAIFLVSLGSDISSEIMKHLREDEVETLTFEIARLETVDAEYKDAVLEKVARRSGMEYIITRNQKDFVSGITKVILPDDFIKIIETEE